MSIDSVQVADKYNILNMITDTHAHYDDRAFDEDRDILLDSMADKNVGTIIHAAADPNGNKAGFVLRMIFINGWKKKRMISAWLPSER